MSARSPLPWLALAVAWTWPSALHPITSAPGSPRTDLWESLWTLWFVATRLASLQSPIRVDGLLDTPGSLWPADPVGAILVAPITLSVGPAVAWTTLVIVHMTMRGWLGARIGEACTGSAAAGWVSGAVLAVASMAISAGHNAATEALGDTWVLAVIWLGLRGPTAVEGSARPWILLSGVLLAVSAWAHWYGGLGAFCVWAVLALRRGLATSLRRAFAIAAVLGLVLAAPVAYAAREVSTAGDNVVGIKDPANLARLRRNIGPADPLAFVAPAPFRSPDFTKLSRFGEDYWHSPYLGWVGIMLALGAIRGPRRWAFALVPIGVLLAIGPVLTSGGNAVILSGRRAVPLPYFLVESLPPFHSLSLLWKLGWTAQVGVAILAAEGIALLGPRVARWAAGIAVIAVLAEARLFAPTRGLPEHVDASIPEPILALAAAPEGAVMSWPLIGGLPGLYEQVGHGKTLAATLNFPASKAAWKVTRAVKGGPEAAVALARAFNIRYVVLHLDAPLTGDDSGLLLTDWAVFPILAEDARVRVLQLW